MFDWSNNIGAIDTKMDRFVLGEKPSFRLMGLCSSYKIDWDAWIISIAKIESKETGVLLLFMTFSSPEIAVYFYKSTIRSCIEYCCHFWGGGPRCYLKMLDKLPKRICRTVNPSLATSLECLIHYQNVTWLSLFHRCFLVDIHLNRLNCFHFVIFDGGLLTILINCMIFLSRFVDVTRISMSTVQFFSQQDPGILCLWNAFLWPMI